MLVRAARPTEGCAASPWEAPSWQPQVSEDVRGAPDPERTWGGGARRADADPGVSALGAPLDHQPKELNDRMFAGWERAA
jgi:hypothetical protein